MFRGGNQGPERLKLKLVKLGFERRSDSRPQVLSNASSLRIGRNPVLPKMTIFFTSFMLLPLYPATEYTHLFVTLSYFMKAISQLSGSFNYFH